MPEGFIDNFSTQSKNYSYSRPTYPQSLFKFLSTVTPQNNLAWDCATGNGQAAIGLAKYFNKVIASDASRNQIQYAFARENIEYKVFQAENAEIDSDSVDIVTVAQALHWFDFDKFYSNVKRVGKKGGIIAVWSYDMHKINPQIDKITKKLDVDGDILGSYWDKEARYVKEKYETITFPFREISVPAFKTTLHWNLNQLWDYMNTWSSVKKYYSENKQDPLDIVKPEVSALWGEEFDKKQVTWNINIRAGVIK
ncbi:MAG TPA: class I SAM-dependent methyltransferase [Nitrososphaeraceae archaeon]|jgi:ubiquinone/menaquinone biosynthesis C-methylase UbiE|nr:class I SAM-dependent methyltransferase [Nitrososphaeraceae archaeon]